VGFGKPATLPTHRHPRTTTRGDREGIRAHKNRIRGGGNAVNGPGRGIQGMGQVGGNGVWGRGSRGDLPEVATARQSLAILFARGLSPGLTSVLGRTWSEAGGRRLPDADKADSGKYCGLSRGGGQSLG
jgi:hypothetical protein